MKNFILIALFITSIASFANDECVTNIQNELISKTRQIQEVDLHLSQYERVSSLLELDYIQAKEALSQEEKQYFVKGSEISNKIFQIAQIICKTNNQ